MKVTNYKIEDIRRNLRSTANKQSLYETKMGIPLLKTDLEGFKLDFATREDNLFFANKLLHDFDGRFHLGSFGYEEDEFDNTSYKATFVLKTSLDQRIGFISVKAGTLTGFAYVGGLYVLSDYRRRGFARKLLRAAENYIRSTWIGGGIDLFTIENEVMDKLLRSEGFKLGSDDKFKTFLNGKYYGEKRWYKLFY